MVKNGAEGAVALHQSTRWTVPGIPVMPIDTTDAGDMFDAGFLFAYVNGEPLDTCLRYGNICGGLSTTAIGGATAAPTLAEVHQWLSKLPS